VSYPGTRVMTEITRCCQKKYGHRGEDGKRIVTHIEELWNEFVTIADPKVSKLAGKELCSEDCNKFYQRYWELFLARHLRVCGLSPRAKPDAPDFLITRDQLKIWIEAVAPSAGTEQIWVPSGEIPSIDGDQRIQSSQTDHDAVLRRWTSALEEKHNKLLGYLDSGIVTLDEPYVIALNSCLLVGLDALHGPSGLPRPLEALFGAGLLHITFDTQAREYLSQHYGFRECILSRKGSPISTAIFLDERYADLSAVLATAALPDTVALHGDPDIIVVYNPLARNKIPLGILGASEEWVVDDLQRTHVHRKKLHCRS
jgi:hypothetical protein